MFERYSRQILFDEIGREGQEKLAASRVVLVGCGALGAAHAETLARAGVGTLRIIDRDFVEYTNLQRQTLFTEEDAEFHTPKAVAAQNRIALVNSEVKVEAVVADINNSNILELIQGCDLVIDGSDNFQVRYLTNDACVKLAKPWIYGAVVSSYGTTMTIFPGETPCLRCVFEEIPDAGSSPTCDTAGVIMPIVTSISAIQTTEALKILTGSKDALHGKLMQIDVWRNEWRRISPGERNPDCPACGDGEFEFLNADAVEHSAVLCGRDAVQISPPRPTRIDLESLAAKLCYIAPVKHNEYLIRFSPEGKEMTIFADGRAIIKGSDDIAAARTLYAKYVGM